MWSGDKLKSPRDLIEQAPKMFNRDYLQDLHSALFQFELDSDVLLDSFMNTILLEVIDEKTTPSSRHFAYVILHKLKSVAEPTKIITPELSRQLVQALPILLLQDTKHPDVIDVIKKLIWCLYNENWPEELQCLSLAFLCKVIGVPNSPFTQDDIKKLSSLLSSWLITSNASPASKSPGFMRSSSSVSITEIDGADTHEFFTVLNYISSIAPKQLRSIYVFSMLRSYLCSSSENTKNSNQVQSFLGGFSSENLSLTAQEYCLRVIDQVDRKVQSSSINEFQKACLLEAIELFNSICLMNPAIIHSVYPVIRRIYTQASSNMPKEPEIQDVAILCACMQFFINHGNSVMHKPDSMYSFLFCNMLNSCFKDCYIAYEIINLMLQNRSQLCYHSSVLEKYFPTFFKVLAWRPNTFVVDFLEILPAFMSKQTSLEIFHSLLDLPCLTSVLLLMDAKSCTLNPKVFRDPKLLESLKTPSVSSAVKYLLREISGNLIEFDDLKVLHMSLQSLASHYRVVCCAQAVIPLIKQYFQVLLQYADASVIMLIVSAILDRLSLIYPVQNLVEELHEILADTVIKLFKKHPETVFHCQKSILSYLSCYKNYYISEKTFMHMVWVVGEYVSNVYSSICRPEIIATFFENIESSTYESLPCLKETSDDQFLKFLSISLTAISKLAARNQDNVPRAILCLSKVLKQLKSFENEYKLSWKIVIERVQELLSILNIPSIAAIVLSPPKDLESGRLHRDPTSLSYVLRTISDIVTMESSI